ncbi:MAG: hypothetical protein WCG25_02485 [bacterium]
MSNYHETNVSKKYYEMILIDFIKSLILMLKQNKKLIQITAITTILMLIIILLPRQDNVIIQTLRIIFGSIYVLFLP